MPRERKKNKGRWGHRCRKRNGAKGDGSGLRWRRKYTPKERKMERRTGWKIKIQEGRKWTKPRERDFRTHGEGNGETWAELERWECRQTERVREGVPNPPRPPYARQIQTPWPLAATFPCGVGAAPTPARARSGGNSDGSLMVPGAPSMYQGVGLGAGAALGYP